MISGTNGNGHDPPTPIIFDFWNHKIINLIQENSKMIREKCFVFVNSKSQTSPLSALYLPSPKPSVWLSRLPNKDLLGRSNFLEAEAVDMSINCFDFENSGFYILGAFTF